MVKAKAKTKSSQSYQSSQSAQSSQGSHSASAGMAKKIGSKVIQSELINLREFYSSDTNRINIACASARSTHDAQLFFKLAPHMDVNQGFDSIAFLARDKKSNDAVKLLGMFKSKTLQALKNKVNNHDMSIMHIAAYNDNTPLTEELIAKKFNINIRANNFIKPMLLATFCGHVNTVQKLASAYATRTTIENIITGENIPLEIAIAGMYNRLDLIGAIQGRKIEPFDPKPNANASIPKIDIDASIKKRIESPIKDIQAYFENFAKMNEMFDANEGKHNKLNEVYCEFFKAIFGEKEENPTLYCEKFLQIAKNIFLEHHEHMTSAPSSAAMVEMKPTSWAKEKTHIDVIQMLLTMNNFYKFISNQEEETWFLDFVMNYGDAKYKARLLNVLCVKYLHTHPSKAISYGQEALEELKDCDTEEPSVICLQGLVFYNMGLLFDHRSLEKSLEYFNKSCQLMHEGQAPYRHIWSLNVRNKQYQEALRVIKPMNEGHNKVLTLITNLYSSALSPENAKLRAEELVILETDECYYDYLYLMAEIHSTLCDYDNALSYSNKGVASFQKPLEQVYFIIEALKLFQIQGKFKEGLLYLLDAHAKYNWLKSFNLLLTLKYYEFIIYEQGGEYDLATEKLLQLNESLDHGEFAMHLCDLANQIRISTEINLGHLDKAQACLKFTSYNEETWLLIINNLRAKERGAADQNGNHQAEFSVLDALVHKAEKVEILSSTSLKAAANSSVLENGVQEAIASEAFDDYEFDINKPDPKIIHAYFQNKKTILAKQKIEECRERASKNNSWALPNGQEYVESQLQKLDKYGKFYGIIDPKLSLEGKLDNQFTRALDHGITGRAEGENGVKLLKNGGFELKINGSDRLLAEVYINSKNVILLIFNKKTNHVGVGDYCLANKKVMPLHVDLVINQHEEVKFDCAQAAVEPPNFDSCHKVPYEDSFDVLLGQD